MLQIFKIHLDKITVKLYFTFMQFVLRVIGNFAVIGEEFKFYVEQFQAAFDYLNQVYLKYDQTFYTKEVQDADEARDKAFRRMRDKIRAIILGLEDGKVEAAEKLLKIIDLYGGASIPSQKMNAESASITNLIEDFEDKFAAEVETLGIGALVADLKAKNQDFLKIPIVPDDEDETDNDEENTQPDEGNNDNGGTQLPQGPTVWDPDLR